MTTIEVRASLVEVKVFSDGELIGSISQPNVPDSCFMISTLGMLEAMKSMIMEKVNESIPEPSSSEEPKKSAIISPNSLEGRLT